jgi:hypothetical protein
MLIFSPSLEVEIFSSSFGLREEAPAFDGVIKPGKVAGGSGSRAMPADLQTMDTRDGRT